jgi:hypothetical protein
VRMNCTVESSCLSMHALSVEQVKGGKGADGKGKGKGSGHGRIIYAGADARTKAEAEQFGEPSQPQRV